MRFLVHAHQHHHVRVRVALIGADQQEVDDLLIVHIGVCGVVVRPLPQQGIERGGILEPVDHIDLGLLVHILVILLDDAVQIPVHVLAVLRRLEAAEDRVPRGKRAHDQHDQHDEQNEQELEKAIGAFLHAFDRFFAGSVFVIRHGSLPPGPSDFDYRFQPPRRAVLRGPCRRRAFRPRPARKRASRRPLPFLRVLRSSR